MPRWILVALCLPLIVAIALIADRAPEGTALGPDAESSPKLYLAGIAELSVVDVEDESVRHLDVPQIGAGDPPYLIAPVGDRLALWSYDVFTLPFASPGKRPVLLARKGWIFIPSADPDAIWVGFLESGPNRRRKLSELREIASDGTVLQSGIEPPRGRWPFAALTDGLLFQDAKGLRLWDPATGETIRRVPYAEIGDAGPADGNVLVSCGKTCEDLHLTDFGDGSVRVVPGIPGKRLVAFEAEFSPDGSKLAVPVLAGTGGWQSYSERGRRLAIVDLASGAVDVIPGSHVPEGYVFTGWSAGGEYAFVTGGAEPGEPRTIKSFRLGDPRASRLDVEVSDFYAMVAR